MFLCYLLFLLSTFILNTSANFVPQAPPQTNTTVTSSTSIAINKTPSASVPHLQTAESPNPDQNCCFVVQDVVSEEWWGIVATSSIFQEVTRTQITAYLTPYPTTTITSYDFNFQTTNASIPVTAQIGINPISLFGNGAPHPTEVAQLNNGTALTTGGVTVQSPAAFYIYSTVKVITAAAITDGSGNLACGTSIGGFPNMNQNAQAYFGGPGIDQSAASSSIPGPKPRAPAATPVVISLTTPFIYQPARGESGATGINTCSNSAGTEDYGYVPQTVLDYLIANKAYSSQYPGLAACLPAGPSIIPSGCSMVETSITTFTTTLPASTIISTITASFSFFDVTTTQPDSTITSINTIFITSTLTSIIPESTISGGESISKSIFTTTRDNLTITRTSSVTFTLTEQTVAESTFFSTIVEATATDFITEIAPGTTGITVESTPVLAFETDVVPPSPSVGTSTILVTAAPLLIPAPPTYVPVDSGNSLIDPVVTVVTHPSAPVQQPIVQNPGQNPAGQNPPTVPNPIVGAICQIIGCATGPPGNTPGSGGQTSAGVSVIVQPTTIPLSVAPPGLPGQISTIGGTPVLVVTAPVTFAPFTPTPDSIPGASVTIINGSPSIVISSSTLIPVVNAPPQLSNVPTTIINNTPFLVVGPTTIAAPSPQPSGPSTTNIGGTNFVVFPSATNIPLSNAPPGLTGSLTIINNTPFIAVPGSTNIPVQATQTGVLSTTIINGTPFAVVGSPTQIPLANAPPGLNGVTTTISGTAFLIIPSATTLQLSTSIPGLVTVINGITEVIFTGLATVPVNSAFSLSGLTTVISGITEVILSTPTTISLKTSPSSASASTLSTISLTSSSKSSTRSSTSSRSSSSSRTSSSISSTSASQSPTATSATPSKSGKGGLSTGAKVGIAFAVILFALLALGLILFLRRRRQDREEEYAPVAGSGDEASGDAASGVAASGEGVPQVVERLRPSTQIGADSYTPAVRTRGGYVQTPQDEWMSSMRRQRSVARRPVGAG